MKVGIFIPRVDELGLSRAGIALYDLLSEKFDVTLLHVGEERINLENRNHQIVAGSNKELLLRLLADIKSNHMKDTVLITMGFIPDLYGICIRCKGHISSIRGNLYKNYYYEYGLIGVLVAFIHYLAVGNLSTPVALNKEIKNHMRRMCRKNIRIIPNFISKEEYKIVRSQDRNGVKFLYTGTLAARKRVDLAIKSIAQLVKEKKRYHLTIVGKGPKENYLKELTKRLKIENNVRFVGQVDDVSNFLVECDVFVLPSESEGTSRSLMEALACGQVVVVRDLECNNGLVKEGVNGFLFKTETELVECIQKAADRVCGSHSRRSMLPYTHKKIHVGEKWKTMVMNF